MIIQPILEGIEAHLLRNLPEYLTFCGALAIAAACTIPAKIPSSMQELWTWFRDIVQTAVPAARNHQPSNPPSPAEPGKASTK